MPELPEVDAVVRRLREACLGARVHSAHLERAGTMAPQTAADLEQLAGARVVEVRRRAKYILIGFDGGAFLEVHLRMTGNLYVLPDYRFRPHTARAWFRLSDGRVIVFEDSRALGRMRLVTGAEVAELEAGLGPEPLEAGFTVAVLRAILRGVKAPIKPVLMDQSRIAGIGNIYASEALWHARIHPRQAAGSISAVKVGALHRAILQVLQHAVVSAYAEYTQPGTVAESESFGVAAYGRDGEPCPRCQKAIERIVQGGRSSFFCPRCQREM
jgi:formamidopyrimidine-DNA glycosylase